MLKTQHNFLIALVLSGALAAGGATLIAQDGIKRGGMPTPPSPSEPQDQDSQNSSTPDSQAAKRAILIRNEKDFRAGVERLCQLTEELRDELQKTPDTDVFSVHMYKKTEEIEKLAKQLKRKAKG
jgi:hypothetical protein